MMNRLHTPSAAIAATFLLCSIVLTSCGGGGGEVVDDLSTPTPGEWVVVHELSDAEGLNPFVTNDASATAILNHVYERLLDQNWETLELEPRLAEARPDEQRPWGGVVHCEVHQRVSLDEVQRGVVEGLGVGGAGAGPEVGRGAHGILHGEPVGVGGVLPLEGPLVEAL